MVRLRQDQIEQLAVTHRNSLRLLKLVNTLLEFSRIEAGRLEAKYEPTELAGFTAELCGVFRAAIERAGMRLVVECAQVDEQVSEPVYVDRDMWEKIVLNLLSNAFKFTFRGEISVRCRKASGFFELNVRDTGIGIPEQELGNLFKRFHRVEGARGRTFEGSGIGLALVQELVKLHGGGITVKSASGKGTEFTVSIPLGQAHLPAGRVFAASTGAAKTLKAEAFAEEALRWLPDSGVTGSQSHSGSSEDAGDLCRPARGADGRAKMARVLVADDNADMREYVRRLLAAEYEVITVPDGEAALAAARKSKPDLVLSDVMMPRIDGFGLLRAIRSDPQLQAIPVILLSARAGEESRVEGLNAGADDYLIKPFSARELVARVESHVKMARLRQETFERERKLRDELEARAKERLEQAVAERTESLREAIAQMEEFSYSVSHDLRSPVRAMQGYAKALEEDFGHQLDSEGREYLERIIQGSARMERLIHEVLTYSRASRMEMKLQPVSLEELVREIVRQYPELHSESVEIVLQPNLPIVLGHEPSLGQAVANLLNNAVKFVAPRVRPKVRVYAEQKEGRVVLRVQDNGIGIKPEQQGRLFGMFERIHPDAKYEGTGIGLAIVRKTVERMGGKVGVESDGVHGSTFWIELPAS